MRLLRPSSSNKQNTDASERPSKDKHKHEQLKSQLKSAYAQINLLKDTNKKLLWRAQNSQKQLANHRTLQEEVQFLREQDHNVKQQLLNYEDINQKLRQQLERLQKQNDALKHHMQAPSLSRDSQSRVPTRPSLGEQGFYSNRSNQNSMRFNSCISDRQKSNHCSTPKNKMRINFEELIPNQLHDRKRVFLQ